MKESDSHSWDRWVSSFGEMEDHLQVARSMNSPWVEVRQQSCRIRDVDRIPSIFLHLFVELVIFRVAQSCAVFFYKTIRKSGYVAWRKVNFVVVLRLARFVVRWTSWFKIVSTKTTNTVFCITIWSNRVVWWFYWVIIEPDRQRSLGSLILPSLLFLLAFLSENMV